MKNILLILFIFLLFTGCHSLKFTVRRTIINVYENDTVKVLVTDNNDIIEAFKEKSDKKCKQIILGKKYSFRVYPVSDLIRGCYSDNIYYLENDTVSIKYARYFTVAKFKNYCIKK